MYLVATAIVLCTNFNYMHSPDCKPVEFHQSANGDWSGTLVNGEKFTQKRITKRIMLFESESKLMRWLVYEGSVVYLPVAVDSGTHEGD